MVKAIPPSFKSSHNHAHAEITHAIAESSNAQLQHLRRYAELIDQQPNKRTSPWFDKHLFSANPWSLTACVREAAKTLAMLSDCRERPSLSVSQAQHLSERACAQITALQRTITQWCAKQESDTAIQNDQQKPMRSTQPLDEQLSQHQVWEQRLRTLVLNKQYQLQQARPRDYAHALEALNMAQQRLARCQQAKSIIEAQLIQQHIPKQLGVAGRRQVNKSP